MSNTTVLTETHIGSAVPLEKARLAILRRIMAKIQQDERGCWLWQGFRTYLGYGDITVQGKGWAVHRLTFTLFKGPIPDKMQVCHKCDVPACCNPDHLFLGTAKDNSQDSRQKGRHYTSSKTHCRRGHAYAEHGQIRNDGKRVCIICDRARHRMQAGWPEHLALSAELTPFGYEAVPPEIKVVPPKRQNNRTKTHCIRGHELSGANLYIKPNGERQCRACRLAVIVRLQEERRAVKEEAKP